VTTVAAILAMAAHIDGLGASVVDMTGLAQKNGAVFSHLRLSPNVTDTVRGRIPPASADLLLACDALVAASPEALVLCAKDRTLALANHDVLPTADFIPNRDARFDAEPLEASLAAACASFTACPANTLAARELGDTVFANMIMLGFAWQAGQIPVSAAALARAIEMNGVAVAANRRAFLLGRLYAAKPGMLRREVPEPPPTPETEPLDAMIARREAELTAYQNAAYARRYRNRIAQLRTAEARLDAGETITRAAAQQLFRLMAIKDEYEVARLYTDGRFRAGLPEMMHGKSAQIWLSPPLLAPKDASGRPRKIAFGSWMLHGLFPMLTRLKVLRGTPLDLFGATAERRQERALLAQYEATLDEISHSLSAERAVLAAEIAAAPAEVRGFGHVKEAALARFTPRFASLCQRWRSGDKVEPAARAHAEIEAD
jgi:indolepyruvate ferredoxin oxidoreductase